MSRRRTAKIVSSTRALNSRTCLSDCLRQAVEWFTGSLSFTNLSLHGNVSWKPIHLIHLTVLWVWSDSRRLTDAFVHARGLAERMFGQIAVTTYQGLCGALRKYTDQLRPQLESHFHRLMEHSASSHWRIGEWLALAVDGSRVSAPRTKSNEQAFAIKNFGSGARARSRTKWKNKSHRSKKLPATVKPQVWLTLIWHIGLKMPWCWKSGPSTASEQHHFMEMLQDRIFPEKTLFCCDAGFLGYDLWRAMLDRGHSFVIRVGGNVRLIRNLGFARQRNGLVYLWPEQAMRKQNPPLELRLLELQGPRGKIYLVTNILSERALSAKQAASLYRLRWGVELQFRTLKQTFGRTKLRSRTAENILIELDWSLIGLWMIQLYAVKEQIKLDLPPAQSSVALALHSFQAAMRNWSGRIASSQSLIQQLGRAQIDSYQRQNTKQGRHRPKYKHQPNARRPLIRQASGMQQRAYRTLMQLAKCA